jgi:outer membrane protein insertion porin family
MKKNNDNKMKQRQGKGLSLKFLALFVFCFSYLNMVLFSPGPSTLLAQEIPEIIEDSEEPEKNTVKNILLNEPEEDVVNELPVIKIEIEGNVTIPAGTIIAKLRTPIGRKMTGNNLQRIIRDDIRTLYRTRWFYQIVPKLQKTDEGVIVVFQVLERPVVQSIEYKGYKKVTLKRLQAETGLKKGSPFDTAINRDAAKQIQRFYRDKGFTKATVKLVKGNKSADRDVVFQIYEGPKMKVTSIKFENNKLVSDAVLRTKILTKKAILYYFGGKYEPKNIESDYEALRNYYHSLGYFDLKIDHKIGFSKNENRVYLTYILDEGVRFKVRNRKIHGNNVLSKSELEKEFDLNEGDLFNERDMNKDLSKMKMMYGKLGRLNATVEAIPVFLAKEPGQIDLVYKINEDRVYHIRRVTPHLQGEFPHTKLTTIVDRMQILPGDLANPRKILFSKSRLGGSGLFERAGPKGIRIDVKPVEDDYSRKQTLRGQNSEIDSYIDRLNQSNSSNSELDNILYRNSRSQPKQKLKIKKSMPDHSSNSKPKSRKIQLLNGRINALNTKLASNQVIPKKQRRTKRSSRPRRKVIRAQNIENTETKAEETSMMFFHEPQLPKLVSNYPDSFYVYRKKPRRVRKTVKSVGDKNSNNDTSNGENSNGDKTVRAQNFNGPFREPGNPIYDNSPFGDPYAGSVRTPPGEVDLDVYATEAQTGRLMFGVGVNSDAGVVGSIVLSEQNFDIMRWPRGWGDRNAFRGGGQSLRIEAVPGNEVSRYMISWTDPYFLGTNYSLGVSGFHFSRFYSDWDELRTGGRVSLGHQFTQEISAAVAVRMESVELKDPDVPTPQILADSVGTNFLSTIRPSISHDTRDSAFLPSEGHFIELAYEQAVGDYSYSKVELEGKQHFTVYSRPDGGGRHTLTFSGRTGWTGSSTPIFERYYAGGFQTFRGFAFRGVTPRETGVKVGGEWLALGSVEYMLPMMANETIHGVAFTDFGTVEQDVGFDEFRITAGLGLRITVPAMGPAPLAFDFAWPISKNEDDDTRLFSFYIGFQR